MIRLKEKLHNKILKARSIEHLIMQEKFQRLWDESNDEERANIEQAVDNLDRVTILKWLKRHPSLDYGEMDIRTLRQFARESGIRYYSRLSKPELIFALERIKNEKSRYA